MNRPVAWQPHRSPVAAPVPAPDGDSIVAAVAHRLEHRCVGPVHLPGDPDYEAQRQPLHPTIDPRPAFVVEASGPADVQAAVEAARRLDRPVSVQATGHGTHVPADSGILIKTANMAAVLVDPDRRLARVGPGARWAAVLAAAAPFGLAPISGSAPSVGVTGYTLGGGVGWLSRAFGFAAPTASCAPGWSPPTGAT